MRKWFFIVIIFIISLLQFLLFQMNYMKKNNVSIELHKTKTRYVITTATNRPFKVRVLDNLSKFNISLFESLKNFTQKKPVNFDYEQNWLVPIHIQKTSGTNLDIGIVTQLLVAEQSGKLKKGCERVEFETVFAKVRKAYFQRLLAEPEYVCKRADNVSWYLAWHERTFRWSCGIHPGLSEWKLCLTKRLPSANVDKFHFITMLRSPIERYVSEWIHVMQTGSVWVFEGASLSDDNKCQREHFKNCMLRGRKKWTGVSLENFMNCTFNLATNRQTRMLALFDSNFTVCEYLQNKTSSLMDVELLERAIKGLESLSFFGMTDHQRLSMLLFEKMFNKTLVFEDKAKVLDSDRITKLLNLKPNTNATMQLIDKNTFNKIQNLNRLDTILYDYAKAIFFKRLKYFNIDFA